MTASAIRTDKVNPTEKLYGSHFANNKNISSLRTEVIVVSKLQFIWIELNDTVQYFRLLVDDLKFRKN